MAMNIEQARLNMVENQVRPWEVLDGRVLDVLGRVRREDFVAAEHRQLAFADLCLPLGHGEVMMKPVVEGRVLQALELLPSDRVLEIGTGSGFLTACLASLSAQVTSVDIHADFIAAATQRLQAAGIAHATLAVGEAVNEWQPDGLFDALVVTGAVHAIPPRWLTWLKPAARALVIRGQSPVQQATLLTHEGAGRYREETLFETDLPYLTHAEPLQRFVF
ncbi:MULTISPECIES: protein-L-isoaspartate O-methyltransferase family protein [Rhodanobacter]|uniref:Protein-L-isoaspartate O-methyltransferase n=1 Tax=Rhodanobacter denitrificans TaxID=666685 RepID=M4NAJ6_9GAMM|nr:MULTISPECIES: protein-L-isoaspartate O-methyltransferase [Rhodanobacter]AGG87540.1 protein-L-isoaspartate carboxylmethyltransferase [Rhodanobacter denitrificans]UJJ51457.1 protein-L-isoaspartate O-methyltransferase [Rhodanobacter denitrificans]UJM86717.1 protein-L-isoaspartate O-methyltransferase [Rhodanobacter denitrificans]UJM94203.1 protein-L-isoaspartate O-methyltransferase [Rhodanobacter denitrificans]UJM97732.1 protein-L-isoaspartate O-methyltransferase [Rhodanobacter denitrificans]